MKGKDLLIIGAAVFVLYKMAQVKPTADAGQYLTNPATSVPASGVPANQINDNITLIDIGGSGGFVAGYSPSHSGAASANQFATWVKSIPIGNGNDPRTKPAVINVNDI